MSYVLFRVINIVSKSSNNQRNITIEFKGYSCLNCKSDQEIFRQGFCKSCFFESPLAGDWIIKPELSKAHLNIADRDLEYEKKIQLQPHIVYLSNTGSVKVGITRKSQIPYRWIDQGAHEAIEIIETPNRFLELLFLFFLILISESELYVIETLSDRLNLSGGFEEFKLANMIGITGTLFAYYSILILNFGDYSRYVKDTKELIKGNISLAVSCLLYTSDAADE